MGKRWAELYIHVSANWSQNRKTFINQTSNYPQNNSSAHAISLLLWLILFTSVDVALSCMNLYCVCVSILPMYYSSVYCYIHVWHLYCNIQIRKSTICVWIAWHNHVRIRYGRIVPYVRIHIVTETETSVHSTGPYKTKKSYSQLVYHQFKDGLAAWWACVRYKRCFASHRL